MTQEQPRAPRASLVVIQVWVFLSFNHHQKLYRDQVTSLRRRGCVLGRTRNSSRAGRHHSSTRVTHRFPIGSTRLSPLCPGGQTLGPTATTPNITFVHGLVPVHTQHPSFSQYPSPPPFHSLRWSRNFAVTLGRATSPRSTGPCNKTSQSRPSGASPPSQAVGLSIRLTSICFMSSVLQIQVKCCNNLMQKTWLPKSKLRGGEGQSKSE